MTVALLNALSRFFAWLSRPTALRWGRGLGWFMGSVVRFRRGEALRALVRSFPDKSLTELRATLDAMYRNLGMTVVEITRVSVLGLDDLEGHVYAVGQENIPPEVLERRKGSLCLMGHIGNWELCGWASTLLDGPISVVVKPMGSRGAESYISLTRKKMNVKALHFREAYRDSLRALRDHGAVAVILDQNTRRSVGTFVDFFGRSACTSPGLAILASQTQVPVVPMYAVRKADHDHELHFLPPIAPPPDRKPESLTAATQAYTRVLEDIIRRHPEQWIWIHRRWKSRPLDEVGAPGGS